MFVRIFCVLIFAVFFLQPAYSIQEPVKNVIFFIGDGMQMEHEIAGSRYLTGQDTALVWHSFPYASFVTTWDINTYNKYALESEKKPFSYYGFSAQIGYDPNRGGIMPYPFQKIAEKKYFLKNRKSTQDDKYAATATDSAAAGTALATGVKTSQGNVAWLPGDLENGKLKTIADLIKEQKMASVGVVTTVPFNHATPACFVSHNVSRGNYFNKLDSEEKTSIAEEILKITEPEVVIGGGHPVFTTEMPFQKEKYVDDKLYKAILLSDYVFAERTKDEPATKNLMAASLRAKRKNLKLFGLFGSANGDIEYPQPVNNPEQPMLIRNKENPSLADSVLAALTVLSKNENGFFLMAEQGNLDWANHDNDYKAMVGCVVDLNEAVKAAINFVNKPNDDIDWNNTLILVTSDHANSYMRIEKHEKLEKGDLPFQINMFKTSFYPFGEVSYGTHNHTNELVNLYVMGAGIESFKKMNNLWYPGTKIIDNTQIFDALIDALGINYDKKEMIENRKYELPEFEFGSYGKFK